MSNPTNPFGPVVSATVSAFTLVALVLALSVLAAGLRDAILNDWSDDVPDPLDDVDLVDDDPDERRVFRLEGDEIIAWLEAAWLEAHGRFGPLSWPPADPEPWRYVSDDDGEARP